MILAAGGDVTHWSIELPSTITELRVLCGDFAGLADFDLPSG
jgi:hypothetical protein